MVIYICRGVGCKVKSTDWAVIESHIISSNDCVSTSANIHDTEKDNV